MTLKDSGVIWATLALVCFVASEERVPQRGFELQRDRDLRRGQRRPELSHLARRHPVDEIDNMPLEVGPVGNGPEFVPNRGLSVTCSFRIIAGRRAFDVDPEAQGGAPSCADLASVDNL